MKAESLQMREEYLRQFAPPGSKSSAQIEGRYRLIGNVVSLHLLI